MHSNMQLGVGGQRTFVAVAGDCSTHTGGMQAAAKQTPVVGVVVGKQKDLH